MKGMIKDDPNNYEMIDTSGINDASNLNLLNKSQQFDDMGDIEIKESKKTKITSLFPSTN